MGEMGLRDGPIELLQEYSFNARFSEISHHELVLFRYRFYETGVYISFMILPFH